MKDKILVLVVSLALFGLCFSCDNKEIYYKYHQIKHAEWSKLDTLYFEIDSTFIDPSTLYNISIELTNNANYPYQNIWFYVFDNIESDSIFKTVSNQYMVADEMGKWYGSGFGALYQLSLIYKDNVQLQKNRSYIIKLVHGMRDEPLSGIERVGLKIEKSK